MASLRHEHKEFIKREAEIVAVGPENSQTFKDYWAKNFLPFVGLPDTDHTVLDLYWQEVKLLKLGRMPAQFVIDKEGKVRFVQYSQSMRDIATNEKIFHVLNIFPK